MLISSYQCFGQEKSCISSIFEFEPEFLSNHDVICENVVRYVKVFIFIFLFLHSISMRVYRFVYQM